jgi:Zn-dependent peptidase ImmA (M78 family)
MISQYEHGAKTPQPEVLERIARGLNLPLAFFMQRKDDYPPTTLFFRSLSAATKSARIKERIRFKWHLDITRYVRGFAVLPDVSFPSGPDWEFPADPLGLGDDTIDLVATNLREFWGLGDAPVSDMVELLEENGTIVVRCPLGAESLDSYSGWEDGTPHIVLGADKMASVRSRFDAAHELGHLILHHSIDGGLVNRPVQLKEVERQAHLFAGAFLLPATSFSEDFTVPTLDGLLGLKTKWRVSVGVMIKRAAGLHFVSTEQEQRLWIAWSRRGWRHREPYDEDWLVEEPRALRAAFDLGRNARAFTLGALRTALPYASGDIEQLGGLPHGYLTELRDANVRPALPTNARGAPHRLINFPQG